MKKYLPYFLLFFVIPSLFLIGQQPNVTGPISSFPGILNYIPMYSSSQQGIPTITPSHLVDTGTQLQYKGVPISNGSTINTLTGTTPNIVVTSGDFTITLSGTTVPTVSGIIQGVSIAGQICQPVTGGPYTWTWPAAFHGGGTIGTTANTCSQYQFKSYNGTSLVAVSTGVTGVAP